MEDDDNKKMFAIMQREMDLIDERMATMGLQLNEMIAETEEMTSQVDKLDRRISILERIVGI